MTMKSITFRCSAHQYEQITNTIIKHNCSRTMLIIQALEFFLNYAEQDHIRNKNLFHLVEDIDAESSGPSFAEQA